jgi:crotonobetainyl-CoA:carnitine CoA-transferase CaiB-like acyl-CoA transferase
MKNDSGSGLLDGIRVLDFTLAAAGPFCSRIMCDLGADVIHVEWPRARWAAATDGREVSRFTKEAFLDPTLALFAHCNAGKRSLAVNLKKPEGIEIIKTLVARADVLIENMSPRVMEKFGLTYAELSKVNPRLVMCSMSGFGRKGLDGDTARPCSDPIAQAMSGISWITGERDGAPYGVGGGLGDTVTSMTGVAAILAALVSRDKTGVGQDIDLSMVESLAYLDCTVLPNTAMAGEQRGYRNGQQLSYTFPMGPFKAAGGYISLQAMGAGPGSPWARLCGLMGREDMITDERLTTDRDRLEHVDEVVGVIEEWLCSLEDRETALALLGSERISSGPCLSQEEMLSHPFFAERGTFGSVDYPEIGAVKVVEPPFKLSGATAQVRGPAPEVGEHTREIAHWDLGLSEEEIERAIEAEVLFESLGARRRNGEARPAPQARTTH